MYNKTKGLPVPDLGALREGPNPGRSPPQQPVSELDVRAGRYRSGPLARTGLTITRSGQAQAHAKLGQGANKLPMYSVVARGSVLFTELQPDSERSQVAARSFLFAEFQLNRESELYLFRRAASPLSPSAPESPLAR